MLSIYLAIAALILGAIALIAHLDTGLGRWTLRSWNSDSFAYFMGALTVGVMTGMAACGCLTLAVTTAIWG